MAGVFITFEGPEGSGKSTQIRLLAERLLASGLEVVETREPGGTPAGEAIRSLLQHDAVGEGLCATAETLLFEASRAQLVHAVIRPALARGAVVLCDRFADSTTAYQGYGRGFDPDALLALHAFAVDTCWPACTVLLELSPSVGLARIASRGGGSSAPDRMEREALAFHERVAEGYRSLVAREPSRFRVVDASGTIKDVQAGVWEAVRGCISGRDCAG